MRVKMRSRCSPTHRRNLTFQRLLRCLLETRNLVQGHCSEIHRALQKPESFDQWSGSDLARPNLTILPRDATSVWSRCLEYYWTEWRQYASSRHLLHMISLPQRSMRANSQATLLSG